MWLFTQDGFVSIVAYDAKKDRNQKSQFRTIAPKKGTHLLLRARVKEDLDTFKTVDPDLVIETDEMADYAFRAVLKRALFKKWMSHQTDAIDYDSHFKEVTRDRAPVATGRYGAMMSVWSAMIQLQPRFRSAWSSSASLIDGRWPNVAAYLEEEGHAVATANAVVTHDTCSPYWCRVSSTSTKDCPKHQPTKAWTPPPPRHPLPGSRNPDASFRYGYGARAPYSARAVDQPRDPVTLEQLAEMLETNSLAALSAKDLLLTDEALELWASIEDDVDRGVVKGDEPLSEADLDAYVEFVEEFYNINPTVKGGVDTEVDE